MPIRTKFLQAFSGVYLIGVDISFRVDGNLMDPVKLASIAPATAVSGQSSP